jgi:hypothetical protein
MNLKVLRTLWRHEEVEVNCMYSYFRHLDGGVCVFIFTSRPRYPKGKDRACLLNGRVVGVQSQFLGNVSWVKMKWNGKDMEVIVAYFKTLAWLFLEGLRKNHKVFKEFQGHVCPVGL